MSDARARPNFLLREKRSGEAKMEIGTREVEIFPHYLTGEILPASEDRNRRAALARRIVDRENPWFARAVANQVFSCYMGRGLQEPVYEMMPTNPPSHPELLEALARSFRDSGYDYRALERAVVGSRSYALASIPRDVAKPPTPEFFAVHPVRPLDAHQLFRSLLGATDLEATAARRAPGKVEKLRENAFRKFRFAFDNDEGEEADLFGGSIPQALLMMNNRAIVGSQALGKQSVFLASLAPFRAEPRALVTELFLRTLGRDPSGSEIRDLAATAPKRPAEFAQDLMWALLQTAEFSCNH